MILAVATIQQAIRNPGTPIHLADHAGSAGRNSLREAVRTLTATHLSHLDWRFAEGAQVSVTGDREELARLQEWTPVLEGEPPTPLSPIDGWPFPDPPEPVRGPSLTYNVDIDVSVTVNGTPTTAEDVTEEIQRQMEILIEANGALVQKVPVAVPTSKPTIKKNVPTAWDRLMSDE